MGRNSSGTRGGLQPGDGDFKGEIKNIEPLVNMDKQIYRDTKAAISRYHAVMGVRQREVHLADLPDNTLGVHVTRMKDGKWESDAVYLNKKRYKQSRQKMMEQTKKGYESGWHTKTLKPMAHTVTHELAHATWNDHLSAPNAKAAGKEIQQLYQKWSRDKKKKGYGEYAKTNVNEFWAECVTKAVHGASDKYTRKVKHIARKYKL